MKSFHRLLDNIHLFYLGTLPAIATYITLVTHGTSYPGLLLFGGIVGVSVYLAAIISYTRNTKSLLISLFTLLDGPLWVLVLFLWKRSANSGQLIA